MSSGLQLASSTHGDGTTDKSKKWSGTRYRLLRPAELTVQPLRPEARHTWTAASLKYCRRQQKERRHSSPRVKSPLAGGTGSLAAV